MVTWAKEIFCSMHIDSHNIFMPAKDEQDKSQIQIFSTLYNQSYLEAIVKGFELWIES